MISQKEFMYIKSLIETENQLIYRADESYKQAKESKIKEELQKFIADVTNQRSKLMNILEFY